MQSECGIVWLQDSWKTQRSGLENCRVSVCVKWQVNGSHKVFFSTATCFRGVINILFCSLFFFFHLSTYGFLICPLVPRIGSKSAACLTGGVWYAPTQVIHWNIHCEKASSSSLITLLPLIMASVSLSRRGEKYVFSMQNEKSYYSAGWQPINSTTLFSVFCWKRCSIKWAR